MATHTPTPVIHYYKEINPGKFDGVKHYKLDEVKNGKPQLSELINISKNRQFAKSNPVFWIKTREGNCWNKKMLTGLFQTKNPSIFYGDKNFRTSLILFKFNENRDRVTIYFYPNFYTLQFKNLAPITVK